MRITRTVPATLVAVAVAVAVVVSGPAAQAQPADIHASVAQAAAQSRPWQDLPSPDVRDAAAPKVNAATTQRPAIPLTDLPAYPEPTAAPAAHATGYRHPVAPAAYRQDLRSPDAVDAAADREKTGLPTVPAVDGDFDWGDAGIGAGLVLPILVAVGGGFALAQRRRSVGRRTAPIR
jgi:hypothetical protein